MVERLCYQLRNEEQLTSCVTVKIRYANFDTHSRQQRVPYTAFDHILGPVVHRLFEQLYQRRMRLRLVGVRFSHLVHGVQQIDLFEDTPEMIRLYQAMDKMRRRYGEDAVRRGTALNSG
jgi:DNA polymerase-4